MHLLATLLVSLLFSTSANAFVEKLHANDPEGGGIPCLAIGTILQFYIAPDGPSGAILNSIIQREWVPLGWSERDLTDNANLVAAIAALPNQDAKEGFVHKVEGYCILWELDVDEFNTPSRYRARLGLPAQPPP